MKKVNKSGFTLVELLATLVILGLLVTIAAPNIVGILQSTKQNTYIEDAKKLATLAEYKFRSDSSIEKPQTNGNCITLSMEYLGKSEFRNAPYGGEYLDDYSFVKITRENNEYKYYVQLIEADTKTDDYGNKTIVTGGDKSHIRGVPLVEVKELSGDDKMKKISHGLSESSLKKYDTSDCSKYY